MQKILFVPISIVGCGKSTVFRTVRSLYPSFVHIENDNFDNKHDFYHEIKRVLADSSTSAVLLDRNNHLKMHRTEIMNKLRADNVTMVALLFVPKDSSAQQVRGLVLDRIVKRGDNHQQVKSKTDLGKAKMILNNFVKNFAQYDVRDAADSKFDYVVEMASGQESSRENVRRIVKVLGEIKEKSDEFSELGDVSDAQIAAELEKSFAFTVSEAPETA